MLPLLRLPASCPPALAPAVVKNGKGEKVIVFKYKPKKGYRRKQGHRQPYTKVTIGKISV
mgnify:CR=1 FL=1